MTQFEARAHLHKALCASGYPASEATELIRQYDAASVNERLEKMEKQVSEIHEFIQMLGTALNNPMVRAMIPANLRGNI